MTPDQIAQLATLSANVKSLVDGFAELKKEMQSWRSEYVSTIKHDAAVEALERRVAEVEAKIEKGGFFAWVGKSDALARTVLAVVAVGALIVAAVRGWPGA